ncbi:MAG: DUF72 domain-containing protein [Nitrososphaerota archaeon]
MVEIIVGCGGWQYFQALNEDPLRLYSLAFKFVEVNSTFYNLPDLEIASSWRKRVPEDFEFSIKANRKITHSEKLQPSKEVIDLILRHIELCRILRSRMLVFETPKNIHLKNIIVNLSKILEDVDTGNIRILVEPRCGWRIGDREVVQLFKDLGVIPVTDYSREEPPYDDKEISYSRLFGKGEHNIYQFTDEDLKTIKERAEKRKSKRVYLSFHGISMYLDAARMERFLKKGELPPVTSKYGIDSLEEVLRDAVFPTTKQDLIKKHGWKLVDIDRDTRVPASVILKQLRKDTYRNLRELVDELRRRFERT